MSAYNCLGIDFVDGVSQYRFYKNPVSKREYLYGEESVIQSDRIDKKIKDHIGTPFGYGDVKEDIVSLSPLEIALRHQRCIVSSTNRAKNMVYNYVRGNVWEWFITLTFDKNKVDRYNYKQCSIRLRKWFNNMKMKYAADMKYLVVPEEHKGKNAECKCSKCGNIYKNYMDKCPICKSQDKVYAYHFHGLLSNTGTMRFDKAFNKCTGEILMTKSGLDIYNFGNYKMGHSTATQITDTAKAGSYITKYITKELSHNTKGFRRYYPSNNLELSPKSFFSC